MIIKTDIRNMNELKVNHDDYGSREALKYSLQPLISSAQLFNAAPLPIKTFSLDRKRWSRKLILGVIVQSLWAIILVGASSVCLMYKRRWRLDAMNVPFFIYILFNMELFLGLLNCSMVFLACQMKRSVYDKVITHMIDILEITEWFTEEQDLIWLRYQFNKYELAGIFYIIIIVLVDGTYYWKLIITVCTTGAYTIPSIVQFLSLLQYAYVVMFAYRKCRAINATILTIRCALKSNLNSYCSTVRTLRKQHMLLHRLVFEVSHNFGPLIILSNFSVLIAVSVTCLEMHQFIYTKAMTISTIHYLVYSVLWVLMYGCKLILVLYPNHLMENERELTGMLLHGIPLIEDVEFKNEISAFSRQILHQKGPYTANGIFKLNLTVLVQVFGALTTYLVILIQFDQSSKL